MTLYTYRVAGNFWINMHVQILPYIFCQAKWGAPHLEQRNRRTWLLTHGNTLALSSGNAIFADSKQWSPKRCMSSSAASLWWPKKHGMKTFRESEEKMDRLDNIYTESYTLQASKHIRAAEKCQKSTIRTNITHGKMEGFEPQNMGERTLKM